MLRWEQFTVILMVYKLMTINMYDIDFYNVSFLYRSLHVRASKIRRSRTGKVSDTHPIGSITSITFQRHDDFLMLLLKNFPRYFYICDIYLHQGGS
uniref:Uncharacterized protein n=1 Tax=Lepeophtheirus salmonis TaxID=72036 RepID=A0A0K2TVC6_LEPSM